MEVMEGKKPRARRSFTPEFKAEIVELCQRGDRSIGQVAWDFDLTETAVREWVRQAERDSGMRSDGGLTSAERQELAALLLRARIYIQEDQPQAAIPLLEKLVALDPDHFLGRQNLMLAYGAIKDDKRAAEQKRTHRQRNRTDGRSRS